MKAAVNNDKIRQAAAQSPGTVAPNSSAFTGTRSTTTHPAAAAGHEREGEHHRQHHRHGIMVIACVQASVAAVMISTFFAHGEFARRMLFDTVLSLAAPATILFAGVTLAQRRPIGWWMSAAVFYFVVVQSAATMFLALCGVVGLGLGLSTAMLCTGITVLAYLNRPAVMESIAFDDRTPAYQQSRVAPAMAGFAVSFLFVLVEIIGL